MRHQPRTRLASSSAVGGPEDPIRLVVGLGNPGPRYAATRHNAGQMVVERMAAALGVGRPQRRFAGAFWQGRGPAGPVALLVPETYMNDSGRAVGPAAGSVHAAPAQVLVVHDEIDLPFGTVRGKVGGGHGGHNGLRSVAQALGGATFCRIRVGVGRAPQEFGGDEAAWVLARFSEGAERVERLLGQAQEMAEYALGEGMGAAIARFHASEPGAKARRRHERRQADAPDAPTPDAPETTPPGP